MGALDTSLTRTHTLRALGLIYLLRLSNYSRLVSTAGVGDELFALLLRS